MAYYERWQIGLVFYFCCMHGCLQQVFTCGCFKSELQVHENESDMIQQHVDDHSHLFHCLVGKPQANNGGRRLAPVTLHNSFSASHSSLVDKPVSCTLFLNFPSLHHIQGKRNFLYCGCLVAAWTGILNRHSCRDKDRSWKAVLSFSACALRLSKHTHKLSPRFACKWANYASESMPCEWFCNYSWSAVVLWIERLYLWLDTHLACSAATCSPLQVLLALLYREAECSRYLNVLSLLHSYGKRNVFSVAMVWQQRRWTRWRSPKTDFKRGPMWQTKWPVAVWLTNHGGEFSSKREIFCKCRYKAKGLMTWANRFVWQQSCCLPPSRSWEFSRTWSSTFTWAQRQPTI